MPSAVAFAQTKLLGKQQICFDQERVPLFRAKVVEVWRIVSLVPSLTLSNINVSIPGVAPSVVNFWVNNTRWAGDYGQQHSWHSAKYTVLAQCQEYCNL